MSDPQKIHRWLEEHPAKAIQIAHAAISGYCVYTDPDDFSQRIDLAKSPDLHDLGERIRSAIQETEFVQLVLS